MDNLVNLLKDILKSKNIKESLKEKQQKILINNINENLSSVLIPLLFDLVTKKIIVITPNLYKAQKLYDKLVQMLGEQHVYFFPMDEFISAEMLASSNEFRQERINTLINIIKNKKGIIVTHTIGAIRKLPPKKIFQNNIITITNSDTFQYTDLITKLVYLGYKRVSVVEEQGEFALRGGIIDIFPFTSKYPYRIEFFGDEVDSIRYFDEKTQRTLKMIEKAEITPIYELIYDEDTKNKTIKLLTSEYETLINNKKEKIIQKLNEVFSNDIKDIENYENLSRMHKYIDYFYKNTASIIDYLDDAIIINVDYQNIYNNYVNFNYEYHQYYTDLLEANKTIFIPKHFYDLDYLVSSNYNQIYFQQFTQLLKDIKFNTIFDFNSRNIEQYYGVLKDFYNEMKRYYNIKTYCICFRNKNQLFQFSQNLSEQGLNYVIIGEKDNIIENKINLLISNLTEGFEIIDKKIKVITPYELFKQTTKVIKYRSAIKEAKRIKYVEELKIGDYVVHNEHGIGQYMGIKTLLTNGVHKDYLQIIYKGEDKLYVPVENINLIQKYVGREGKKPKIHKIGSTDWFKTKKRVQSKIKDIANKLINLYSIRENTKGYAFSKDTKEQKEFEDGFEFVETPDQLQAIKEVKQDMENSIPMDRLLCGDVGYGKTEVAMRAAFKAVMDNKQVAYLAPTTILTQQHYDNFIKRFSNFPINIALLNRFVSIKSQKEIIKKLSKGQIDIVIGTHRLLSNDVKFYDLGLLIVDEEQRFGVEHKEKIKELKVNVDVLTLTATPIPRTLQMSLIGVRSLSLLETPPENRYPIQTYVLEENETIIKEAIERELARNGQVFYLANRIEYIDGKTEWLKKLVPDAKITYAHGKMPKEQLENTMIAFLNKKYDVLVCTTIIETGIDIANANTLIISDADKLGLSQLYQIRGRVGRSDRIAYAYLMYPKRKVLSEVAKKRLMAIKEFTELGAGFKIAKQDLAIRGAGDILGSQQYGFIDSIGFEMYSQLLKHAVNEAKDKRKENYLERDNEIDIRVLVDAYIPESYIDNESLKIEMYKKIKLISSEEDLINLENELIDRFSDYPQVVQNLLNIAFIKSCCLELGITKMLETKTNVEYYFSKDVSYKINGEKLFKIVNEVSTNNIELKYLHEQIIIIINKPRLKEDYLMLSRKLFVKFIQSRIMLKNE